MNIEEILDQFDYRSIIENSMELKGLKTLPFEESFNGGFYLFVPNSENSIEVGLGKKTKLDKLVCLRYLNEDSNELLPDELVDFSIGKLFDYKQAITGLGKFKKQGKRLIFDFKGVKISFEISNKQTIELIEITDKNGIQLNLKNQGNLQKFEQIKGAENSETIQSKLIGTWIFSKELTRSFLKDEKTLEQCCLRAQDENKLIFSKNGELAIEGRSRTFKLKYKISRISKKDILNLKILTERYDVLDKRYKMSESGLEYYPNTNEGLVFIYQKE